MRFEIYVLLALAVVAYAQKPGDVKLEENRSFTSFNFTTFTLIKTTTTTTSTFTSTITCTTSTAALTTCTAGRRRRGLFYDEGEAAGRNRRGLFYNEDDKDVFIARSDDPVDEVKPVKKADKDDVVVPLELQSGYSLPDGVSVNRFLLAFGTSTVTSITVTTSTSSLTATCSSVTNFPTCGTSGK